MAYTHFVFFKNGKAYRFFLDDVTRVIRIIRDMSKTPDDLELLTWITGYFIRQESGEDTSSYFDNPPEEEWLDVLKGVGILVEKKDKLTLSLIFSSVIQEVQAQNNFYQRANFLIMEEGKKKGKLEVLHDPESDSDSEPSSEEYAISQYLEFSNSLVFEFICWDKESDRYSNIDFVPDYVKEIPLPENLKNFLKSL